MTLGVVILVHTDTKAYLEILLWRLSGRYVLYLEGYFESEVCSAVCSFPIERHASCQVSRYTLWAETLTHTIFWRCHAVYEALIGWLTIAEWIAHP